jgi:hypothetical protein
MKNKKTKNHLIRSKITGKFISKNQARKITPANPATKIVNGRLYHLHGTIVRALKLCSNGYRLVGVHKRLFGFAKDSELSLITPKIVKNYLKHS